MKSKQELIEKWESAVEAAEFYGKGKEERLISYMKDFVSDLNQLDEPEVLSQEWIDEHEEQEEMYGSYGVPVRKLQNLLMPKQELPVIPKFVAEFLIGKEDYMLYELFDDEWLYKEHDRVAKWLYDNDELTNKQREIDLVMARDRGFTVEKEQEYTVSSPKKASGFWFLSKNKDGEVVVGTNKDYFDYGWDALKLTEQEIKDYDERYMNFAVKVEELEE